MNDLQHRCKKLHRIKKALFLDENVTEASIAEILQIANFKNFLLINEIVLAIRQMPDAVKSALQDLLSSSDSPQEHIFKLRKVKTLFRTNPAFISYNTYVQKLLLVNASDKHEKQLFNFLICHIASDYLSDTISLESSNVALNLRFILKWLDDNFGKTAKNLTNNDCNVLACLIYGFDTAEIISITGIKDLDSMIFKQIPQKFGVQNLSQVMMLIFWNLHHICWLESTFIIADAIKHEYLIA